MFRFLRFLFITIVLAVVSLYLFLLFVDINRFREPIEKEISSALNREIIVERMGLKMSLSPTLSIRGLRIKNPTGFDNNTFAKIDEAEFSFAILPLLKGIFQVDKLALNGIDVSLIQKDGKNNWSFENKSDASLATKSQKLTAAKKNNLNLSRLNMEKILVRNAKISYVNATVNEEFLIQNFTIMNMKDILVEVVYKQNVIQLTLNIPDFLKSISSGEFKNITLNIKGFDGFVKAFGEVNNLYSLEGINLIFDASSSNLNNLISLISKKEKDLPLLNNALQVSFKIIGDLTNLKVEKFKATLNETASLALNADVKNILKEPSVSLNGNFSFNCKELIKKYGLQPISADFDGVYDKQVFTLSKLNVLVNKSDVQMTGYVDLTKEKPFVKADITSDYFSIADLMVKDNLPTVKTEKENSNVPAKEAPQTDLSALKSLDGAIKISFSNLKLFEADNTYHKGFLQGALQDGVLVVNPFQFDLLSGQIFGVLQLNAKETIPVLSTHIKGNNLMIGELDIVQKHLKEAPLSIDAILRARGANKKDILSSLTGTLQAQIPSGVIVNKWFNSLPGVVKDMPKNVAFSYTGTEKYSNLTCAAMKLDVKNGTIISDKNIAFETPTANITVSGDIDLSKENLSLSVLPSFNQGQDKLNKKLSYAQHVKIEGPFSDIKIKSDVQGALEQLKDEKLTKLAQKLTGEKQSKEVFVLPSGGLCKMALGEKVVMTKTEIDEQPTDKTDLKKIPSLKETKESLKEKAKEEVVKSLLNMIKKK